MKTMVVSFLLLVSLPALAMEKPSVAHSDTHHATVKSIMGRNGDYGFLGVELGVQLSPHWEAHGGVGLGPNVRLGGGVRLTTLTSECFLFKYCKDQLALGVTATHGRKLTVEGKDEDGKKTNINLPEATFVNANLGATSYFFKYLNLGVQIGYQHALGNKKEFIFIEDEVSQSAKETGA